MFSHLGINSEIPKPRGRSEAIGDRQVIRKVGGLFQSSQRTFPKERRHITEYDLRSYFPP
jgi:hypothetical protein